MGDGDGRQRLELWQQAARFGARHGKPDNVCRSAEADQLPVAMLLLAPPYRIYNYLIAGSLSVYEMRCRNMLVKGVSKVQGG